MTGIFTRFCFFILFALLSTQSPSTIRAADDNVKKQTLGTSPAAAASPSHSTVTIEEVEDIDTSQKPVSSTQLHSHKMPFKLGFEFQLGTLCKWALTNNNLQKKPIFLITNLSTKEPLWHLVIDTCDIEFVTKPFSSVELPRLERCIDSILLSFNILMQCLDGKQQVSFELWRKQMEAPFKEADFLIENVGIFELVKDQVLMKESPEWKPRFSPQVTIQHPLEFTNLLSFALLGYRSSYMLSFSASLPFRDSLYASHDAVNSEEFDRIVNGYRTKLAGLVFLHALTLVQMTPEEDDSDKKQLEETLYCLKEFHQVDPKTRFALLSRRPFSSMLKDLNFQGEYSVGFKEAMKRNYNFMKRFKVPVLFSKTNYAEQFFDEATGQVKSLRSFLPLFEQRFLEAHRTIIEALLDQGVISTAMLRNLKADVKTDDSQPVFTLSQQYYDVAIKSVTSPEKRYNISVVNAGVISLQSIYDALSPAWFLDKDNSMGAFKQEIPVEDRKYGEAIVEFRAIRRIGPWFLRKAGLDTEVEGYFLTIPTQQLKVEVRILFDFLKNLGKPQDFRDFALGMTSVLPKY